MTDLDKLIEAVDGGDDDFAGGDDWLTAWGRILPQTPHDLRHETHWHVVAWKCLDGSLDAAKALHEALLPRWKTRIDTGNRHRAWVLGDNGMKFDAYADNPARAWLIAILRAYRAQAAE